MHDITMLFLGAATIVNSVSIIILAASMKKQSEILKETKNKAMDIFFDVKRYKSFAEQCFKNFCFVKDGFRKVRRELINKNILTQDFEYLDEDEAVDEFIDEFIKS